MNKQKNIIGKTKVALVTAATSKLVRCAAVALALLAVSGSSHARTLIAYVNTNTWALTTWEGDATVGVWDREVIYTDYYNNKYYRRYTAGLFDTVVLEKDGTFETLQTLTNCNNIFYIVRSAQTAYYCSAGYNGTGNGVNGLVVDLRGFNNGDAYIGGEFTSAGNRSYTSYFSCYRWSSGWSRVSGVYADAKVDTLSWSNYKLVVEGDFNYVYGPLSSGGSSGYLYAMPAYLNDYYEAYADRWWSDE